METLFILACVGATFIINFSYIFMKVRERIAKKSATIGKLVKCPMCTGFWIGLTFRALFMWHESAFSNLQWSDLYNICYGFASSFICYATYLLLKFFMDKYD
jgi:hypothetical protein